MRMRYFFVTMITALLFGSTAFAQSYTISGSVTDETGEALVGANVLIQPGDYGDVTDWEGNYSVANVPAGTYNVRASFVGFETVIEQVELNADATIDFQLAATTFETGDVVVEVNRAQERQTPVSFATVTAEDIERKYTTQDVPDLVRHIPGVFTTSNGLGEGEIYIRGFDAERIQILINGVPVNDPESQTVYWSNWTGLSGNASSIQVQKGVGASLVGSGAFGGSVNIQTSQYSATPTFKVRTSAGLFQTQGVDGGIYDGKSADGTGGYQNYSPAQQNLSVEYTTGQMYDGKLNLYMRYERKSGDSYVDGTYYNGHSYYFGLQSLLDNHILTLNIHGAPQRHNQARTSQDPALLDRLGREYNRNNHPYQENYYHKPVFELHHDWVIGEMTSLKSVAFYTMGTGGGRYLRNDHFDVNNGLVTFKSVDTGTDAKYFGRHARYVYETAGVVLDGFNPNDNTYTYNNETTDVSYGNNLINGDFNHSWRNDSQNNHNQFGFNTALQHRFNDLFAFAVGGEMRYWRAEHYAESFDFRKSELDESGAKTLAQVEDRYNYDGIVTNMSGFARLLVNPIPALTLMIDGQYANYSSEVEENPIEIYDFQREAFTGRTYYASKNNKNADGSMQFSADDYERTFSFFMPKFGANFNLTDQFNVYGNYSISKKEPKVGDWYSRSGGPGVNQLEGQELEAETLTNIEFGVGFTHPNATISANYYIMNFEDKIESVTNQAGDRVTTNAGEAKHSGIEVALNGRYQRFDYGGGLTLATNEWESMNVQRIFGLSEEDTKAVVGKTVPNSPTTIYSAYAGVKVLPNLRIGADLYGWSGYYVDYLNENELDSFLEVNLSVDYGLVIANARVNLRFDVRNLFNREQFARGDWTRDFNRNDDLAGDYYMYIIQSPLRSFFLTSSIEL